MSTEKHLRGQLNVLSSNATGSTVNSLVQSTSKFTLIALAVHLFWLYLGILQLCFYSRINFQRCTKSA